MCGIIGAIGRIDVDVAARIGRAGAAQRHRGPDGAGAWRTPEEGAPGVAFAHRRLAVIDLNERAAQPMKDPASGCVIVYNGEVYNHRALRAALEREGARFRTTCDTEVVLQAYLRWNVECVEHLRGMFALAIWDPRSRSVLLARDRVGIKPLYVSEISRPGGGPMLLFASELRALLATGLLERRLDPDGVRRYLWNGFVVGPGTIVRDVRGMPAATTLRVDLDSGRAQERRYWQLPGGTEATADGAAAGAAIEEAVRERLVADVPVGVFLSGGVDSTAVASLARRAATGPVRTFTVGFDDAAYDESAFARTVAEGLGTEHTEIRLDETTFRNRLPDALASLDQPTFDGINTYFVSRAVREAGVTVALAGTGGDELFGGYRSFRDLPRLRRWLKWCGAVPAPLLRGAGRGVARLAMGRAGVAPPQTRWAKLADAMTGGGALTELYQLSYGLFLPAFLGELCRLGPADHGFCGLPGPQAVALRRLIERQPLLHAISLLELSCFVGERLLRDTDSVSMASSLEVRVPLLDHRVIEAVAALAPAARFRPLGRKTMLRGLVNGAVDHRVFQRPKAGFVLPLERWCRQGLRGEMTECFGDRGACEAVGLEPATVGRLWRAYQDGAPGIYWSRVWALYVLLMWSRAQHAAL